MAIGLPEDAALEQAFDYYDAVTKEDITKVDGVKRASERVRRLMRAYARHQGTQASIATLKEDLSHNDTQTLSEDTINSYLEALRKIFVVEDMPWNPIFVRRLLFVRPTLAFCGSFYCNSCIGLGACRSVGRFNTMGLFFETMCERFTYLPKPKRQGLPLS